MKPQIGNKNIMDIEEEIIGSEMTSEWKRHLLRIKAVMSRKRKQKVFSEGNGRALDIFKFSVLTQLKRTSLLTLPSVGKIRLTQL